MECWESNPGLLGEKQVYYLCAMQPPLHPTLHLGSALGKWIHLVPQPSEIWRPAARSWSGSCGRSFWSPEWGCPAGSRSAETRAEGVTSTWASWWPCCARAAGGTASTSWPAARTKNYSVQLLTNQSFSVVPTKYYLAQAFATDCICETPLHKH